MDVHSKRGVSMPKYPKRKRARKSPRRAVGGGARWHKGWGMMVDSNNGSAFIWGGMDWTLDRMLTRIQNARGRRGRQVRPQSLLTGKREPTWSNPSGPATMSDAFALVDKPNAERVEWEDSRHGIGTKVIRKNDERKGVMSGYARNRRYINVTWDDERIQGMMSGYSGGVPDLIKADTVWALQVRFRDVVRELERLGMARYQVDGAEREWSIDPLRYGREPRNRARAARASPTPAAHSSVPDPATRMGHGPAIATMGIMAAIFATCGYFILK